MQNIKSLYRGHRFPAIVISCAVRWYYRFQLSLRDVEELLFERGVVVSYETIRRWCDKFGAGFARRVKAARRTSSTTWHGFEKLRRHAGLIGVRPDLPVAQLLKALAAGAQSDHPSVSFRISPGRNGRYIRIDSPDIAKLLPRLDEIEKVFNFVMSTPIEFRFFHTLRESAKRHVAQ
ncbi:hypothetical protein BN2475_1040013 [Paraburkholderia ribeironis]|uniref:Transposase n=1 Tax=Paraburkholderia ribeironis TaxID=1247936 RepID=A0A1N7SM25_9BURK|nr:hypothetical protein BN2475_1040013 [Paraburkholderia ribeironis]